MYRSYMCRICLSVFLRSVTRCRTHKHTAKSTHTQRQGCLLVWLGGRPTLLSTLKWNLSTTDLTHFPRQILGSCSVCKNGVRLGRQRFASGMLDSSDSTVFAVSSWNEKVYLVEIKTVLLIGMNLQKIILVVKCVLCTLSDIDWR